MPSSYALLGGFAIGARVALLWQHNDVRALLAGDRRMTGSVLKIARRIWEVGVAGWPFSTLLQRPGLRASNGGVLVT